MLPPFVEVVAKYVGEDGRRELDHLVPEGTKEKRGGIKITGLAGVSPVPHRCRVRPAGEDIKVGDLDKDL